MVGSSVCELYAPKNSRVLKFGEYAVPLLAGLRRVHEAGENGDADAARLMTIQRRSESGNQEAWQVVEKLGRIWSDLVMPNGELPDDRKTLKVMLRASSIVVFTQHGP
jgi:hypothetical protein